MPSSNSSVYSGKHSFFYKLVLLYLIFDYGRLHETIHISSARPLMLITLTLIFLIFYSGSFPQTLHHKQILLMWLFIFWSAILIPFSVNNYYAFSTTRSMLLYMPFITSILICVNSINRLENFLFICILIMIYISIYSIFHSGIGPGNYFSDENDLSLYINMWIPFTYYLFLYEKKIVTKLLYLSGFILGLIAIVISFSRGGFVGMVAVFITIWFFSSKKIVTLAMATLIFLVLFSFSGKLYKNEIYTIDNPNESTAKERIESWKSGWNMFLDNPLGVGGNNFQIRFPEYQTNYFQRGMWGRVAHSLWFTLIPELGIVGITIYLLILYYNVKDIFLLIGFKTTNDDKSMFYIRQIGKALIASISGFFASATFLSVLYYAHYWYITGIVIAAVRIVKTTDKNNLLNRAS